MPHGISLARDPGLAREVYSDQGPLQVHTGSRRGREREDEMNRPHSGIVRAWSWLAGRGWIIGMALALTGAPQRALGQVAWPGYPNNSDISVTSNGNVGIGTTSPQEENYSAR